MAARRPLFAHDAQHLVMRTMEAGPRAERLLDSQVEPFLGEKPPFTTQKSIRLSAVARRKGASESNGMRVPCRSIATSSTRLASGWMT
jgi:hypothetical protein